MRSREACAAKNGQAEEQPRIAGRGRARQCSGRLEDLVQVPFEELTPGPVSSVVREGDSLASLGVEPFTVAEVLT